MGSDGGGPRSLFSKEELILAEALRELDGWDGNQATNKASFKALLKGYKRLLRVTKNLTRVGDRYQNKLHTASTELDAELGRHVGLEIKEEILKGSGKTNLIRIQNLTISFIDIRGFTTFAERLPPEDVIAFLKSYYEYSLEIVHKYHGFVKSFMGDGVMLVFGYNQRRHTSDEAIACSLEILERLPEFNQKQNTQIELGIGLHSGPTAAGNIGTRDRTEFAVIGNTVNMASRIESETKQAQTPLLFSGSVKDSLTHFPKPPSLVKTIALRGQRGQVDLFTFDGLGN